MSKNFTIKHVLTHFHQQAPTKNFNYPAFLKTLKLTPTDRRFTIPDNPPINFNELIDRCHFKTYSAVLQHKLSLINDHLVNFDKTNPTYQALIDQQTALQQALTTAKQNPYLYQAIHSQLHPATLSYQKVTYQNITDRLNQVFQ